MALAVNFFTHHLRANYKITSSCLCQTIYKLGTVLEFFCDPNINTDFMETSPGAQGKPALA